MNVWKRNAVVVAICLFVGAAVYLNWSFNHQGLADNPEQSHAGKMLGESGLVNGVASSLAPSVVPSAAAKSSAAPTSPAPAASKPAAAVAEAQIENLVSAKGYGDCVCFLSANGCSMVVSAQENGLNETDVARILEIVKQETGLQTGDITIIETKP